MQERRLVVLARPADAMSAEALVTFLAAQGIDAHVEGADPLSIAIGGRMRVVIAEDDLRRGRWAIENADVSDDEARLLATGELDPQEAVRAFARRGGESPGARRARIVGAALLIAFAAAAFFSR